ncbi:hypothetical protein ACIRN4_14160 [Pimelobacter simplex]|uniref:hypothetical protein n=1 Tax=Nocardioides simplex TaxID=2045 RepID=UPI003825F0CB
MARTYLDDVITPDGVRVTIALEPSVERLARGRERLGLRAWYLPFNREANSRIARALQRSLLGGTWVVDIESDSGERQRTTCESYEAAMTLALRKAAKIQESGLTAITYDP